MKKFIFTACMIALSAMIPAVFIGYLHNDAANDNQKTETAKEVTNGQDETTTLRMIRTF